MTKQKLQAELLEEVKEGVKPSDLKKKLKRSKSLGDIPSAPPLPTQPNIQQLEQENKQLKEQLTKANRDWLTLAQKQTDNLKKDPNPRITELEKELEETVKDATEEINRQETEIKQLRTKLSQATNQNQDLTRQVNNYQRAAELRINEPAKEPDYSWWQDYGPVILLLGLYALSTWLLNKPHKNHE